jgi:predicted peroxiredoxin
VRTIVCVGTGPSLTSDQIQIARDKGFRIFGCNNSFQLVDVELLYAVNLAWWDHYWPDVRDLHCEKWTTNKEASEKYGLSWIAERNAPGLSTDPDVIHHGHGSGFSLVSIAHKKGAERIILLGYDLKYSKDYDGKQRKIGSGPRHFFGEYPPAMQHWPSVRIRDGVHVELVDLYRSVHEQGLVKIVNCTPGSALEGVIPSMDISDA